MVTDAAVGLGLRDGGVVLAVVAVSTIADDVNHAVASERLTPFCCQATHRHHGIDIVAVDVKDRSTHPFGNTDQGQGQGRDRITLGGMMRVNWVRLG